MRRSAMSLVEMMIAFIIIIIALGMILLLPSSFMKMKKESYMTKELYNAGISFAEELISLPPESAELATGTTHTQEVVILDDKLKISWQIIGTDEDFTTYSASDITTTISSITNFKFNYASITITDSKSHYSYHMKAVPKQKPPQDD